MDSGRDSEQAKPLTGSPASGAELTAGRSVRSSLVLPLVGATLATVALCVAILLVTAPEPGEAGGSVTGAGIGRATPARARAAKVLFRELCAQCHGESGDGNGATELERPARSFLKGGYGYGNTLSVVMRTLEHGIPGTAMPAFGDTISLQERTSLASYVLSLGPRGRSVPRDAGAVRPSGSGAPRLVQGCAMDPTTEALEPRSLVIGFQNGTTVQYSTSIDENARGLRAVAVRGVDDWESQGLLRRTDWRGQGGSPLELPGETLWSAPAALLAYRDFQDASGKALTRRMTGAATTRAGKVRLRFDLLDGEGARVARGHETVWTKGNTVVRTLVLDGEANAVTRSTPLGRPGPDSGGANVTEIEEGLFCVDPDGDVRTRQYIHAQSWRPEMSRLTVE